MSPVSLTVHERRGRRVPGIALRTTWGIGPRVGMQSTLQRTFHFFRVNVHPHCLGKQRPQLCMPILPRRIKLALSDEFFKVRHFLWCMKRCITASMGKGVTLPLTLASRSRRNARLISNAARKCGTASLSDQHADAPLSRSMRQRLACALRARRYDQWRSVDCVRRREIK